MLEHGEPLPIQSGGCAQEAGGETTVHRDHTGLPETQPPVQTDIPYTQN